MISFFLTVDISVLKHQARKALKQEGEGNREDRQQAQKILKGRRKN